MAGGETTLPVGGEPIPRAGKSGYALGLAAAVEIEVHRDLCADLGGFSVQHVRLVAPLFLGIDRSPGQHRRSTLNREVLDGAALRDLRVQHNRSAQTCRPRDRRIDRLWAGDLVTGDHTTGDPDGTLRLGDRNHRSTCT